MIDRLCLILNRLSEVLSERVKRSCSTVPDLASCWWAIVWVALFACLYLPIALQLGFLKPTWPSSWMVVVSVMVGAFFMPGLLEELIFRVLLIPHPTEIVAASTRRFWIGASWVLFLVYHLNPLAQSFCRDPLFLLGAGCLGIICTASYVRTGSLVLPAIVHWLIVIVWLLFLGGLEKFII